MGYPVKAVANAILQIASEHGASITPLKLQKLTYISHGWNLGLNGDPLISDELPEAWPYGPVFPSLYHEFKHYGKGGISDRAREIVWDDFGPPSTVEPSVPSDDLFTWKLLRKVWDEYGKYGGGALSDLTHRKNTPWEITRSSSGGVKNVDIPNDVIRQHYEAIISGRTVGA